MTLLSPRTSRKKFLSLSSSVAKLALRLAVELLAQRKDCRQCGATLLLSRSMCKAACMTMKSYRVIYGIIQSLDASLPPVRTTD